MMTSQVVTQPDDPIERDGVIVSRKDVWCMAMFMCLGSHKESCAEPCNFCWNDAIDMFVEMSNGYQQE